MVITYNTAGRGPARHEGPCGAVLGNSAMQQGLRRRLCSDKRWGGP